MSSRTKSAAPDGGDARRVEIREPIGDAAHGDGQGVLRHEAQNGDAVRLPRHGFHARHLRHGPVGLRQRDEVDGTAIGKIDQHLVALARRNKHAFDRDGPRQISAIGGDDVHDAAVRKTEVKVARIGSVEQTQPDHAAWHRQASPGGAVDNDRLAPEAMNEVHQVRSVAAVSSEPPVLDDQGDVIDAIGRGQASIAVALVGDDHHARQPQIGLARGLMVDMRMVPTRGRRLPYDELRRPDGQRRNRIVRSAVHCGGHHDAVPVQ